MTMTGGMEGSYGIGDKIAMKIPLPIAGRQGDLTDA
jgi:hypothetical protein